MNLEMMLASFSIAIDNFNASFPRSIDWKQRNEKKLHVISAHTIVFIFLIIQVKFPENGSID